MWAQLLVALTGPIVLRVLSTLGLGVVTYTGFTAVVNLVQAQIQSGLSGLPAAVGAIVFLSGMPQAMAIILAALAARVALNQLSIIARVS